MKTKGGNAMIKCSKASQIKKAFVMLMVLTFMFGSIQTVNAASYTSKTFTESESYYDYGNLVITVTNEVTVWFYTDGKIHIYQNKVSYKIHDSAWNGRAYDTSICNTDGSISTAVGYVDFGTLACTFTVECAAVIVSGQSQPSIDFIIWQKW